MRSLFARGLVHAHALRTRARQLHSNVTERVTVRSVPIWRLRGSLRGRAAGEILFAGGAQRRDEVEKLLFAGQPACELLGETRPAYAFEVARSLTERATDLVVAFERPWVERPADALVVQNWILAVCRPGPDYEQHLKTHVSETIRQAIRKAKQRFVLEPGCIERDFDAFYDEMFVPFVSQRFGENALIATREFLRSWQSRTTRLSLLHVVQAGRKIAGGLVVRHAGQAKIDVLAYGARLEILDDKNAREQFTALVNDHVFELAAKEGLMVDMGLTRPFTDDGVLRYKQRWGCRPLVAPGMPRFLVWTPPERRQALSRVLPFLHVVAGELAPAFPQADRPSETALVADAAE